MLNELRKKTQLTCKVYTSRRGIAEKLEEVLAISKNKMLHIIFERYEPFRVQTNQILKNIHHATREASDQGKRRSFV